MFTYLAMIGIEGVVGIQEDVFVFCGSIGNVDVIIAPWPRTTREAHL